MTKSKLLFILAVLLFLMIQAGCTIGGKPAPKQTRIWITFDPGGASTSSEATIYAQNVQTGQTFSRLHSPSQPISITVAAPGTYVFYGLLNDDPISSHFGATG